jgi:hypothetical protein
MTPTPSDLRRKKMESLEFQLFQKVSKKTH